LLGRLVGPPRPTVTLALRELADADLLRRSPKSGWMLSRASFDELQPAREPLAAT